MPGLITLPLLVIPELDDHNFIAYERIYLPFSLIILSNGSKRDLKLFALEKILIRFN
jgi:hypothetical protein